MYLKNIEGQTVLDLAKELTVQQGQIVSKTLVQNSYVGITLFAFSKNEEISTHTSTGDAMVQVLEGTGCFTVGEQKYEVSQGQSLVIPAEIPHAVYAQTDFKMLLTVVFPTK